MNALRALGVLRRPLSLWLPPCLCAAALALADAEPARSYYPSSDAGRFDYYVLALSWAPAFCASHPADRAECGVRHGFVVHGLWPQYAGGGGPEHCAVGEDALDPETVRRARSAMPDEHLIRHEWVVHGTCTGLSPHDYFVTLTSAIGRLAIPTEFDGEVPRTMSASQVVSTFVNANPSLTGRSLALRCRGSQLEEVRICLSRDLQPRPCGRDVHTQCRPGPLRIEAAH